MSRSTCRLCHRTSSAPRTVAPVPHILTTVPLRTTPCLVGCLVVNQDASSKNPAAHQEKVLQGLWRELRRSVAQVYRDPACLGAEEVPRLRTIVHACVARSWDERNPPSSTPTPFPPPSNIHTHLRYFSSSCLPLLPLPYSSSDNPSPLLFYYSSS